MPILSHAANDLMTRPRYARLVHAATATGPTGETALGPGQLVEIVREERSQIEVSRYEIEVCDGEDVYTAVVLGSSLVLP